MDCGKIKKPLQRDHENDVCVFRGIYFPFNPLFYHYSMLWPGLELSHTIFL